MDEINESRVHVPAMQLWSYTCGANNLADEHFEHLLFCLECQALVNQFIETLEEIAANYRYRVA